jgi:glycosyltransferase involved in cell wall biosynthesis
VANLARAWREQGHAVTVICQDPDAGSLPFVDEAYLPGDRLAGSPPRPGTIRVVVPQIGELLPVYVFDLYAGYEVKTIPEMTPEEIERHIALTARALRDVVRQGTERVLAQHALFGPCIARRALRDTGVPYDVKIHGSAVEYVLAPHPRLRPYAEEGLETARRIFVGSRHMRERLLEVFPTWRAKLAPKLHVVPPGLDPESFRPSLDPARSARRFLAVLREEIRRSPDGRCKRAVPNPDSVSDDVLHETLVAAAGGYNQRAPDADLPERWPEIREDEPIVGYVGKFLPAKGVGELLCAFARFLGQVPRSRLMLIGFGSYREHLEGMLQALRSGDAGAFHRYARAGDFVPMPDLAGWFRPLSESERARITLTGMLDHGVLRHLLPLASVVVVPSKLPEAFGMVAVEAMACGVLPLCSDHGGLRDVLDAVAAVAPELAERMRLPGSGFAEALPERLLAALEALYPRGFAERTRRAEVGAQLREIAVRCFSWDGVARRLLDPAGTPI